MDDQTKDKTGATQPPFDVPPPIEPPPPPTELNSPSGGSNSSTASFNQPSTHPDSSTGFGQVNPSGSTPSFGLISADPVNPSDVPKLPTIPASPSQGEPSGQPKASLNDPTSPMASPRDESFQPPKQETSEPLSPSIEKPLPAEQKVAAHELIDPMQQPISATDRPVANTGFPPSSDSGTTNQSVRSNTVDNQNQP